MRRHAHARWGTGMPGENADGLTRFQEVGSPRPLPSPAVPRLPGRSLSQPQPNQPPGIQEPLTRLREGLQLRAATPCNSLQRTCCACVVCSDFALVVVLASLEPRCWPRLPVHSACFLRSFGEETSPVQPLQFIREKKALFYVQGSRQTYTTHMKNAWWWCVTYEHASRRTLTVGTRTIGRGEKGRKRAATKRAGKNGSQKVHQKSNFLATVASEKRIFTSKISRVVTQLICISRQKSAPLSMGIL